MFACQGTWVPLYIKLSNEFLMKDACFQEFNNFAKDLSSGQASEAGEAEPFNLSTKLSQNVFALLLWTVMLTYIVSVKINFESAC